MQPAQYCSIARQERVRVIIHAMGVEAEKSSEAVTEKGRERKKVRRSTTKSHWASHFPRSLALCAYTHRDTHTHTHTQIFLRWATRCDGAPGP